MSFPIAVVASVFVIGEILMGHFEAGTPKWRKLLKFLLTCAIACSLYHYFGAWSVWALIGVFAILAAVIHLWWLPSKGINGWTGEPKAEYYALRGWELD